MSNTFLADVFVMMCDWRGRCAWSTGGDLPAQVGQFVWECFSPESSRQAQVTLAQVVALRESQQIELVHRNGDRVRGWLWPLDSPEMAAYFLGSRVPGNLGQLSLRERDVLDWLAQGCDPRDIAEKLDVSVSTVHTHLKHARDKLEVPSLEGLISFAARYCYPVTRTFVAAPAQA
jgi:DNA-binding CsgD family transcriptional regulator